jgi:hypothetical protein
MERAAAPSDLGERVDDGTWGGRALVPHHGDLDVADRHFIRERHGGDLVGVQHDVELVRVGDAVTGRDERLGLQAAAAFTLFSLAIAVGRRFGDRLVRRSRTSLRRPRAARRRQPRARLLLAHPALARRGT